MKGELPLSGYCSSRSLGDNVRGPKRSQDFTERWLLLLASITEASPNRRLRAGKRPAVLHFPPEQGWPSSKAGYSSVCVQNRDGEKFWVCCAFTPKYLLIGHMCMYIVSLNWTQRCLCEATKVCEGRLIFTLYSSKPQLFALKADLVLCKEVWHCSSLQEFNIIQTETKTNSSIIQCAQGN